MTKNTENLSMSGDHVKEMARNLLSDELHDLGALSHLLADKTLEDDMTERLARFGHHPDAEIDFLIEAEELESIAENARLGLAGFGHEEDRATLDERLWRAMEFRVAQGRCKIAKDDLRIIARARGLNLMTEIAYPGQPPIYVGDPA